MRTLNREAIRRQARTWTEVQRRLLVERVIEELPHPALARLLQGLVQDPDGEERRIALAARVEAHVEATRRREFRGGLLLRNAHGQRAPWQTDAWTAATAHLFELASEREPLDAEASTSLRALLALVEEVDERPDELVVFEDDDKAALVLAWAIERARRLLA